MASGPRKVYPLFIAIQCCIQLLQILRRLQPLTLLLMCLGPGATGEVVLLILAGLTHMSGSECAVSQSRMDLAGETQATWLLFM